MEQALKLAGGDISGEDLGTRNLVQQNIELRKRLDEEHQNYKRKLQAYQDGQQRQASLVQKLQAKVRAKFETEVECLQVVVADMIMGSHRG